MQALSRRLIFTSKVLIVCLYASKPHYSDMYMSPATLSEMTCACYYDNGPLIRGVTEAPQNRTSFVHSHCRSRATP